MCLETIRWFHCRCPQSGYIYCPKYPSDSTLNPNLCPDYNFVNVHLPYMCFGCTTKGFQNQWPKEESLSLESKKDLVLNREIKLPFPSPAPPASNLPTTPAIQPPSNLPTALKSNLLPSNPLTVPLSTTSAIKPSRHPTAPKNIPAVKPSRSPPPAPSSTKPSTTASHPPPTNPPTAPQSTLLSIALPTPQFAPVPAFSTPSIRRTAPSPSNPPPTTPATAQWLTPEYATLWQHHQRSQIKLRRQREGLDRERERVLQLERRRGGEALLLLAGDEGAEKIGEGEGLKER